MDGIRVQLSLTPAEVEFLAYSVAAHALWPPDESTMPLLGQVPDSDVAGGPRFRAVLLAALVSGDEPEGETEDGAARVGEAQGANGLTLDLMPSELWLLDTMLIQRDLRREKLSDGTPLTGLAYKVWRLLRDLYEQELPPQLRRERRHADDHAGDGAYPDADTTIASAEAILRSRHREGTG